MTELVVTIAINVPVKELSEKTRERFADCLSTIAADILKGASRGGRKWEIHIGRLPSVAR